VLSAVSTHLATERCIVSGLDHRSPYFAVSGPAAIASTVLSKFSETQFEFCKNARSFWRGLQCHTLHARGVDLVVDLLDTADYVDRITPEETTALLKEAAMVLGEF